MRKLFLRGLLYVMVPAIFFKCVDDPEPADWWAYSNGVFIINEGNFSDSDGSLSFYDLDSQQVSNNVFELVNDRPLAALFQYMKFHEQWGFIIDGNGRLEIVDFTDLQSVGTIYDDLVLPRYFEGYSNLGFVTDWGPYDDNWMNPDSKLHVIDLVTMQLKETMDTPSRPEGILSKSGMLFVANSGANLVTVYDPVKIELLDSIEVNNGPVQFVVDRNSDIWVMSTGAYISGGALQRIDPFMREVTETVDLSLVFPNGRLAISGSGDVLFFMGEQWAADFSYTETKVYRAGIEQPGEYSEIVSGRNFYGLGVDPVNDEVYVTDAVAFQGNGKVYTYDFTGNKSGEFGVGRGPRDFVFMTQYRSAE